MKIRATFSLILLASLLAALLGVTVARTHAASGSTLSGTYVTVNNVGGDQLYPQVSGDWVSYTDGSQGADYVRYHNLVTGADAQIPFPNTDSGQDFYSAISGTTVVYMHDTGTATENFFNIYRYDIGSGSSPVALTNEPSGEYLSLPAIGNRTVAWEDWPYNNGQQTSSQIVVYNLDSKVATPLTSDPSLYNVRPAVSPDGSVVVWMKCPGLLTGCHIWQAVLSGGAWQVSQLTSGSGNEEWPHTNGQLVVYDSTRTVNGTTTQGIYWQPVGGGTEHEVPFPAGTSQSENAHISGNLISFQNYDTTVNTNNWNIWVYSLATSSLYQVTTSTNDDTLADIWVGANGSARLVWNTQENDLNVYGFLFQAPAADAPLTITHLVAGSNEEGKAGLAATSTDADPNGKLSDYTVTINWGDGTSSKGLIVKNPVGAGFVVAGAHQYAKSGSYTVTLTINDSGGSSAMASQTLVVPPDPH